MISISTKSKVFILHGCYPIDYSFSINEITTSKSCYHSDNQNSISKSRNRQQHKYFMNTYYIQHVSHSKFHSSNSRHSRNMYMYIVGGQVEWHTCIV